MTRSYQYLPALHVFQPKSDGVNDGPADVAFAFSVADFDCVASAFVALASAAQLSVLVTLSVGTSSNDRVMSSCTVAVPPGRENVSAAFVE